MDSCSSSEDIIKLQDNGWYLVAVDGNHHYYKHPKNGCKVTLKHPCKVIPPKTLQAIKKQMEINMQ